MSKIVYYRKETSDQRNETNVSTFTWYVIKKKEHVLMMYT